MRSGVMVEYGVGTTTPAWLAARARLARVRVKLHMTVDLCWGLRWLVRPDGLLAFDADLAQHPDAREVAAHRASIATLS